jgi:hypothetical protein
MIYAYANPAKSNSLSVCEAFCRGVGSGAMLVTDLKPRDGEAFFYGVQPPLLPAWNHVQANDLPYIYADNGYFKSRWQGGDYLRLTRNALQHTGLGQSDGKRARDLGVQLRFRRRGGVPLVALQSEWWYKFNGTTLKDWLDETLSLMDKSGWPKPEVRSKDEAGTPVNWKGTCAVVTHSSNMAVDAIVRGIPAVTSGVSPAAGINTLDDWPDLSLPPDIQQWVGVLADNQWTLTEIKDGTAWKALSR